MYIEYHRQNHDLLLISMAWYSGKHGHTLIIEMAWIHSIITIRFDYIHQQIIKISANILQALVLADLACKLATSI